jgi:Protein of unknown function (DUF2721)
MQPDVVADLQHLSQVISQATAPAFLLGAVAGYLSLQLARLGRILDRIRVLDGVAADDQSQARLRSELPRLVRQVRYMNRAIFFAVCSAICTTVLVILAFASALLGFRHEPPVAWIFILALGLMGASLFNFVLEVRLSLGELELYR